MKSASLDGLVDPRNECLVLGGDRVGVAGLSRSLESLEVGLHRASKAQVLETLTLGACNPLLL